MYKKESLLELFKGKYLEFYYYYLCLGILYYDKKVHVSKINDKMHICNFVTTVDL